MPPECSRMTAEVIPPITSDEGLINFANCSLKMLKEAPRIQRVDEVSDNFLSEIAIILFGSNIVPYVGSRDVKERQENISAVLDKLSHEIDLQLDHICPSDVVSGDRKAVSNMLELLTAFILYCVQEDLLDFDRVNLSYSSCHKSSATDLSVPESSDHASNVRLSLSPEIPRASLNQLHFFSTTLGQDSVHHNRSSELRKPLQIITCDPTSGVKDQLARANTGSPAKSKIPGTSASESNSQHQTRHSSSTTRLNPIHRLHPYFSLPSDSSPPATPKGADEMVEIVKHQSPSTVPPSLQCSPTVDVSKIEMNFVDPWQRSPSPTSCNAVSEKTAVTSLATSAPHQFYPQVIQSSLTLLDQDSDTYDDPGELKQTVIPRRCLNRKTSSSSSGRGHSPTQTLTAPGASVTSTPSSLSDSSPLPLLPTELPRMSKESMSPRDVACQTIENIVPKSDAHELQFNSQVQTPNAKLGIHDNCTSVATTNSILAWPSDHPRFKSDPHGGPGSSTTSVLSSSFQSKSCARSHIGPSPSASVLFAHTEGFSRALKRRLDYLRMIFSRAHDEAEAVGQLVQLISSQHLDTLEFMEQCLRKDRSAEQGLADSTTPEITYSFKPLEKMVQRILLGVEVLLRRHKTHPGKSPVRSRVSSTHSRFPMRRPSTKGPKKFTTNTCSKSEASQMERFEELMNMKHSLMTDTLTWLLSELQSKGRSAAGSAPSIRTLSRDLFEPQKTVCV